MSSFWKAKELKNPMVGSKIMTLRSKLMRPTWFLGYLNRFNSNFDP